MNRKQTMFFFAFLLLIFGTVRTDDPLRPQFHLMPEKNWLNDPNGPVYYNGYYHMFHQYNPNAAVWGDMHWAHCYSKDMVHWVRLPIALAPDQPYDINGIFTGSMTIVNGTPVIIYTGISQDKREVQCQARPTNLSDPTLTNWTKASFNPFITQPDGRDPATAFQDDKNNYYLIYGYGTPDLGGQAVIFTSKDFVNWTYLHPLHSNKYGTFWECPDIFNVSNRVVLKASLLGCDFWTVGNLDPDQHIFTPLNHDLGELIQIIDHGRFYASKTFYDPLNDQQVIMGWVSEDDNLGPQRGWQGFHTLPRAIFLSQDGQEVRSRPVQEVKSLRDPQTHQYFHNINVPPQTLFSRVPSITGNQIEAQISWQFPKNQNLNFGLTVLSTPDGSQRTDVGILSRDNTTVMIGWDVPGWDYGSIPNITQWSQCQVACNNDPKCVSWTYVNDRQINNNCFLKSGIPNTNPASNCVSGVKPRTDNQQVVWVYVNRTLSQTNPGANRSPLSAPLWLESTTINDQWLVELDIFIDHSVIEIFEPQDGRFAITARVYPEDLNANNFAVYNRDSLTNVTLSMIDSWNLTTIWT